MKTYEQKVRESPGSFRYLALAALSGSGGLVAAVTGMSKTSAIGVVGAIFLLANTFIWLRQNPTLKQIEKRNRNASDGAVAEVGAKRPEDPLP